MDEPSCRDLLEQIRRDDRQHADQLWEALARLSGQPLPPRDHEPADSAAPLRVPGGL